MKRLQLEGLLSVAGLFLVAGCNTEQIPIDTEGGTIEETAIAQATEQTLNTFGPDYVQIDRLAGGPGDANLFLGNDPADGTASANLPAGPAGATYIDWQNITELENHFLGDLDDPALGKDPNSFPRSNECVGPSSVLSKMDLTAAGAYNNMDHAYFVVQRSDNNGDAAYYWLFTKVAPTLTRGEAPCRATEDRLMYKISEGDILFSGHFKPSASIPLLRVFKADHDMSGLMTAVEAINYLDAIWVETPGAIEAIAVNTTKTQPGTLALTTAGVKALVNGSQGVAIGPEIIAEVAVETELFTGGQPCGVTFYGSVISRSSGSGGTSPDLKDLLGPARFNFGEVTAFAELSPTCEPKVLFEGWGTGMDGEPLVDPECEWTFDDGSVIAGCEGNHTTSAGSHVVSLTVTDPLSQCADTLKDLPFTVYNELGVTGGLDPTCELSFSYESNVTGGSPAGVSYAWDFSGGGTVNPATSTTPSGTVLVGKGAVEYNAHLLVTDLRTDVPNCTAEYWGVTTPYAPIVVRLEPAAEAPSCPGMSSDAVTYNAIASGGDGAYSYEWVGPEGCAGASCTINPSDSNFCAGPLNIQVFADDGTALCAKDASEIETYQKVTTISITNNL